VTRKSDAVAQQGARWRRASLRVTGTLPIVRPEKDPTRMFVSIKPEPEPDAEAMLSPGLLTMLDGCLGVRVSRFWLHWSGL